MSKNDLIIITNEKIFIRNQNYYCDNIDIKSTSQNLENLYKVTLVGRESKENRAHKLNLNNILLCKNIFLFLVNLKKLKINSNTKFLAISLTPFSFLVIIILKLINKKVFLYLRSDGFKEYKKILGHFGSFVYGCMFSIATRISTLISCQNYILRGKKGFLVKPSQLNETWFKNTSTPSLDNTNILYVGRVKIEKGIFDLIKLIENRNDITLNIVGASEEIREIKRDNINIKKIETDQKKLIEEYDRNNIFILPSFTEGYPQVIIEALSRLRPVIIFKEIEHVIGTFRGIFIAERNYSSLIKQIHYIKNNYSSIQKEMEKNDLPSNKDFIEKIGKIILKN